MRRSSSPLLLCLEVRQQTLVLSRFGLRQHKWPVSTSARGLGFLENSLRTPVGFFLVSQKIGDGLPLGAIFKNRVFTGEIHSCETSTPGEQQDLILTRILRLDGRDTANRNTFYRHIYIHGTNQESAIGTPASHGCIRMRNADVAELYDLVPLRTPLLIEP